jgi:hypothetical protein
MLELVGARVEEVAIAIEADEDAVVGFAHRPSVYGGIQQRCQAAAKSSNGARGSDLE